MVLLITTVNAKPDNIQELKETLVLLAQSARRKAGCLSCHVYGDVEQADCRCLIEAWATQADMDVCQQGTSAEHAAKIKIRPKPALRKLAKRQITRLHLAATRSRMFAEFKSSRC